MSERYMFGTTAEGERIDALRIFDAQGNSAVIIEYGASIQSLVINGPDGPVDVILGYDTVEGYEKGNSYSGATVGRVGNRISNARFTLDGKEYRVTDNENGNCLHSGTAGTGAGNLHERCRISTRKAADEDTKHKTLKYTDGQKCNY